MTDFLFLPCIAGPTGAGKTAAALALATEFPASVVNADSRQVYADFPLITAQPTPEERAQCPHFLYGLLPTEQKLGAGEYARMAGAVLQREAAEKRTPILTGGTGLYFRALLEGIAAIPPVPDEVTALWQERLRAEGGPALHAFLVEADPSYAAKIHPNDGLRITRALEVLQATGKTFSWWHSRKLPLRPYRPCKIGVSLPLSDLAPRLEQRIALMLEQGALEEARRALEACPNPDAPGWSGIGCLELHQHLRGKLSLDECRALWLKNTRAYAKRQMTWFRADPEITWFSPRQTKEITAHVLRCRDAAA